MAGECKCLSGSVTKDALNWNYMSKNISIEQVVSGGYCSGCGACAYQNKTKMQLNAHGEYQPEIYDRESASHAQISKATTSCPFLRPDLNEDVLGKEHFGSVAVHDPYIGYHLSTYGAYVKSGDYRKSGTSGGMGTWIGSELLRRGMIDGVIHAKAVDPNDGDGAFFKYEISLTESAIREGAKTRYHVLEMSEVLAQVREQPGRYLFIGVPCFCKAVRRLQKIDPVIRKRIAYVVSLVCGHYKSLNWTLSLGWGTGVHPNDLSAFQYRTKGIDISSRAYVFRATTRDGRVLQKDSAEVVGGKFNAGAMMLNACDYCDDVVGETADLTIGDAWLPKFDVNQGGTNLLIVRNRAIENLLLEARDSDCIHLEAITAEEATDSQSGGFRQRREGLSYRLLKAKNEGRWAPEKRIEPGSIPLSRVRRSIYDERVRCASLSRNAFKEALDKNDYGYYVKTMEKAFKQLRAIEIRSSFFRILKGRLERILQKIKLRMQKS
jgi:coenzyme F420 hydrogenase subunit beta